MGQTTRGYPYPEVETDPPNGPDQIKALAEAVDTDLTSALAALPVPIVGGNPAYTASGAAALDKPKLWAYHNIFTLNQFGQVAVETPFLNGIVVASIVTGDITAWNGIGGYYLADSGGTNGVCRAFFRCQNAAGTFLGAGNVRAHISVVGW